MLSKQPFFLLQPQTLATSSTTCFGQAALTFPTHSALHAVHYTCSHEFYLCSRSRHPHSFSPDPFPKPSPGWVAQPRQMHALIHTPLRKELEDQPALLQLGLLLRLNPQRIASWCLTGLMLLVLGNMTKLRQPDLPSYFMVPDSWEALLDRDGTKFARGYSILQHPNRDTSQRWHRAQCRRTTNWVLGRYQAVPEPLPRLPPGAAKGIVSLDIPR